MATAASPSVRRAHALQQLLAQYVVGRVAEHQLAAVSDLLDDSDASAEERLAFTRFYLDALTDGDLTLGLPKAEELADFLDLARA